MTDDIEYDEDEFDSAAEYVDHLEQQNQALQEDNARLMQFANWVQGLFSDTQDRVGDKVTILQQQLNQG